MSKTSRDSPSKREIVFIKISLGCYASRVKPPELEMLSNRYGVALQIAGGVQFFDPTMERVGCDRDFSSGDLEPRAEEVGGAMFGQSRQRNRPRQPALAPAIC